MEQGRTLPNNKITQFILRIDIAHNIALDYKFIAEKLKNDFENYRTELHSNYNVNIDDIQVTKEDFIKYLLSTAATNIKLDSFEKCIIVDLYQYIDCESYMPYLKKIIQILKSFQIEINARRIGMRYINIFPCSKISEINKILDSTDAKSLKESLNEEKIIRSMIVREYQYGDSLSRVQFGIPNKFYPSILKNYDIVLDIDVYSSGNQEIDTWEESIMQLNHQAYDIFIKYIKESYLQTLE